MSKKPPPLQPLLILWGSLLVSQFVMLGTLWVIPSQPLAPEPMLPFMFGAAALPLAAASLLLPRQLFKKGILAQNVRMIEVPDPDGLPGFGKTLRTPAEPKALLTKLLPGYNTRVILGCALAEAVSILGFTLKFLGFGWPVALPFFGVGVALCALQLPSRARFVSEIESALGVRLSQS